MVPAERTGTVVYDCLEGPKKTEAPWELSFYWTHRRRKFIDFSRKTPSSICEEMLRYIVAFSKNEAETRGKPPRNPRAVRQTLSQPTRDALRPRLDARLIELP